MRSKKIFLKNKIVNHLTSNGKKGVSEKILLKAIKELQKASTKHSRKLFNLSIILSMPIFKVHKMMRKKRKNKIREIPVIIGSTEARISQSIKFILIALKKKSFKYSHVKLYQEIISITTNDSSAILIKDKIQKNVLLKKHFFYYYR